MLAKDSPHGAYDSRTEEWLMTTEVARTGRLTLALVAGGLGVLAGWCLQWLNGDRGEHTPANDPKPGVAAVPVSSPHGSAQQPAAATAADWRASNTSKDPRAPSQIGDSPDATAQAQASTPKTLAIDEGTLTENPAARSKSLNALLSSSSLSCDISAAQGANWTNGGAQVHGISYQGGPFAYQAINLEIGTATMTGSVGLTGSVDGELGVKVTPTDTGLNFTGFTRSGDLVIVTVYAALDGSGHYRTVMSRHGHQIGNESAQFYGTCDTFPARQ